MREDFLNYISYTACLSKLTVLKYTKVLEKFDGFLMDRKKNVDNPESIELQDVYDFIAEMVRNHLSPTYCNSMIVGIKSYLNYLNNIRGLNVLDSHKIRLCKTVGRSIGYYSEEQKKQILDTVNSGVGVKGITQLRNRLLVYMFFQTGLRCDELVNIKVRDIGESLQVVGKGGKVRFVYLRKELLDMIDEYISKRKKKSEYLFPTHNKGEGHIHKSSIRGMFCKMTSQLGFKIHPHKFRHTFAVDLLHIPGSNIYNVAKLLGHSNISTTQIYLGSNNTELKNLQFGLKF